MKKVIAFIGLTFLVANSTYWVFHFFRTYFAPNHRLIHDVNIAGEANMEAAFLIIQVLFMLPAAYFLLKNLIRGGDKHETKNNLLHTERQSRTI